MTIITSKIMPNKNFNFPRNILRRHPCSIIVFHGIALSRPLKNMPKLGKSSYRRKPVSSHFKAFWTPAFAGVTVMSRFSKVSLFVKKNAVCHLFLDYEGQSPYFWKIWALSLVKGDAARITLVSHGILHGFTPICIRKSLINSTEYAGRTFCGCVFLLQSSHG